ncbi:hypothetical protein GCM10007893_10000 [Paracoccus marinus]|nr:hypothetical protein GCM10007893_10000 [Paracoccus marinus]
MARNLATGRALVQKRGGGRRTGPAPPPPAVSSARMTGAAGPAPVSPVAGGRATGWALSATFTTALRAPWLARAAFAVVA